MYKYLFFAFLQVFHFNFAFADKILNRNINIACFISKNSSSFEPCKIENWPNKSFLNLLKSDISTAVIRMNKKQYFLKSNPGSDVQKISQELVKLFDLDFLVVFDGDRNHIEIRGKGGNFLLDFKTDSQEIFSQQVIVQLQKIIGGQFVLTEVKGDRWLALKGGQGCEVENQGIVYAMGNKNGDFKSEVRIPVGIVECVSNDEEFAYFKKIVAVDENSLSGSLVIDMVSLEVGVK